MESTVVDVAGCYLVFRFIIGYMLIAWMFNVNILGNNEK